jgi:ATP/maltotriose-dependent transcriptional regulator MalT
VKRHVNNIYAKLNVHTRTQAVAKGKELKVLFE